MSAPNPTALLLAACPFCHTRQLMPVTLEDGNTFIECSQCHATGPLMPSEALAIQQWNMGTERPSAQSTVSL